MMGTWSMAFWGRKTALDKLSEGIEFLTGKRNYRFVSPCWKCAKWFRLPDGTDAVRFESEDEGQLHGIVGAMRAFHFFAPELHAACRCLESEYSDEWYDLWYLAPGAKNAVHIDLQPVFEFFPDEEDDWHGFPECDGDVFDGLDGWADGVAFEEAELASPYGEPVVLRLKKGYRFVLDLWDNWD